MPRLTTDTFRRPVNMDNNDDPAVLYVRSYLLIRTVVGFTVSTFGAHLAPITIPQCRIYLWVVCA